MTAREVLGGIKGRLTKATPGPWKIDKEDPTPLVSIVSIAEDRPWGWVEVARSLDTDAEFIAAAPVDVARLTRAVEAVLELARAWEVEYGSGSKAEQVLGKQKVSIDFAVGKIRAAIENALKP